MKQLLAILGALLICGTTAAIAGTCAAGKPQEEYTAVQTTIIYDGEMPEIIYEVKPLPYDIGEYDRQRIEAVVEAEAGAESLTCQTAVANCIYNELAKYDGDLKRVLKAHAKGKDCVSKSVKAAVSAVFDRGDRMLDDDVLYYVNPEIQSDKWHRTQRYVCTLGSLDFYAEVYDG